MLLLLAWKIQGSLSPVHPSPSVQSKEPPPHPRVLLGTPGPVQSLLFPGANWVVTTGAGESWPSWMQVVELRAEQGPPVHARRYALRCGASQRAVRSYHATTTIPPTWGASEAVRGISRSPDLDLTVRFQEEREGLTSDMYLNFFKLLQTLCI